MFLIEKIMKILKIKEKKILLEFLLKIIKEILLLKMI